MNDWLLSIVWYSSLLAIALGAARTCSEAAVAAATHPAARAPAIVIAAALLAIAFMIWLAPATQHDPATTTALDRALPTYQFRELHARSIDAPVDRVRRAHQGSHGRRHRAVSVVHPAATPRPIRSREILNAPDDRADPGCRDPIRLHLLIDSDAGTHPGQPSSPRRGPAPDVRKARCRWFNRSPSPGVAKAGMNFVIEPDGPARTTPDDGNARVRHGSTHAARRFTAYWRTIFPGSWILRVTWLNAIARRAEAAHGRVGLEGLGRASRVPTLDVRSTELTPLPALPDSPFLPYLPTCPSCPTRPTRPVRLPIRMRAVVLASALLLAAKSASAHPGSVQLPGSQAG